MSASKNQNSYLFSFGNIEDEFEDIEEWNLSDKILSEDVVVNKPSSIENLSENMENLPHTMELLKFKLK